MKIYGNQLSKHLKSLDQPVYIVSGDEPLLVQEAADAIRASARASGFSEREVYHVEASFDWEQVLFSANSMSLFADRKLLELRFNNLRPGDKGAKALTSYCESPPDDTLMLILLPRLDAAAQRSKWFKTLESSGLLVQVWPIERREMPSWLAGRFKQAGMTASREAIEALVDRLEGNLLAAVQEVERLRLTANTTQIELTHVLDSVADSARYNVFDLIDTSLSGDVGRGLRMLNGLRSEGGEPLQLNALIAREIRNLAQMREKLDQGQHLDAVLKSGGVWAKRKRPVTQALKRLSSAELLDLELVLAGVDKTAKGQAAGDPWDGLSNCIAGLGGVHLGMAESRR